MRGLKNPLICYKIPLFTPVEKMVFLGKSVHNLRPDTVRLTRPTLLIPRNAVLALFCPYGRRNRKRTMKNLHKNLLATLVFGAALAISYNVHAQFPAAAVMLVNNDMTKYSVNSTEDYIRVEEQMTILGEKLRDAHKANPNLNYTPVFDNEQIVAFVINGVKENSAADEIANNLMQLEVLADVVKSMDDSFLPTLKDSKLSRVSKREASK